jgi:hypothetical protein
MMGLLKAHRKAGIMRYVSKPWTVLFLNLEQKYRLTNIVSRMPSVMAMLINLALRSSARYSGEYTVVESIMLLWNGK